MTDYEKNAACQRGCWGIGAGVGLVLALILWLGAGWSIIQAIFAGIVVCVICGLLFAALYCAKGGTAAAPSAPAAAPARQTKAATATSTTPTAPAAEPVAAAAAANAPTAATASKQPAEALSAQAGLAEQKSVRKSKAEAKPAVKAKAKPKAVAKPAKAEAAVAPKATAPKAAAPKAAAPKAAAKPKRAPVAPDGKPELLKKARSGGADDLKLISGVGPKLEGVLNSMGVWHFDQMASWRKKEVQWVNDNLEGFKGRVERDDWVSQAKILAKGGETEFSVRKKK